MTWPRDIAGMEAELTRLLKEAKEHEAERVGWLRERTILVAERDSLRSLLTRATMDAVRNAPAPAASPTAPPVREPLEFVASSPASHDDE